MSIDVMKIELRIWKL